MFEETDPFEDQFGQPPTLVTKLTLEEIEIALSFLKRRFPRFTIEKIVSTLDHYNCQKSQGLHPRTQITREQAPEIRRHSSIANKWDMDQGETKEQRKIREEENLRLVARLFCQGGDDYSLARRYMPELAATSYRNMLLSIANWAFRELAAFLGKECRIKTKELSEAQKVTIKTAIISAHEWMGTKSLQAIETLFKFISNKFYNSRKAIVKQEAIELYTVIAQRVNHNSLDLLTLEPEPDFGQQIEAVLPQNKPKAKLWEEDGGVLRLVGEAFLECCDLDKMSNELMRKYGISKAWEESALQLSLRRIMETSVFKLKSQEGPRNKLQRVKIRNRLIDKVLRPQHVNLQYGLVQFFLGKIPSKSLTNSIIQQIKILADGQDDEYLDELVSSIESESGAGRRDILERMPASEGEGRILDDFTSRVKSSSLSWKQEHDDDILFFED